MTAVFPVDDFIMPTDFMKRLEIEQRENWRGWVEVIPALHFRPKWRVKIIPPFCGAMVRFQVSHKDISVYLDVSDTLGCFGEPYWEIYPYEGDTYRCAMNETDELIRVIGECFKPPRSYFWSKKWEIFMQYLGLAKTPR